MSSSNMIIKKKYFLFIYYNVNSPQAFSCWKRQNRNATGRVQVTQLQQKTAEILLSDNSHYRLFC